MKLYVIKIKGLFIFYRNEILKNTFYIKIVFTVFEARHKICISWNIFLQKCALHFEAILINAFGDISKIIVVGTMNKFFETSKKLFETKMNFIDRGEARRNFNVTLLKFLSDLPVTLCPWCVSNFSNIFFIFHTKNFLSWHWCIQKFSSVLHYGLLHFVPWMITWRFRKMC